MPLSEFIDKHCTALSLGAMAVGVLAVLVGVTRERQSAALLPGEAARVNGHTIDSDTFQRTFAGFTQGLKRPVTAEDRKAILNRLIDEEVMVQRAMALGLPEQDPTVRKQLVQAMIALALAQGAGADPTDAELKAYVAANAELFRMRTRAKIDAVFVRENDNARHSAIAAALAKNDWSAAKQAGETPPVALPDDFLIASKIADYVGADAASAVLRLEVGQATDLIAISGGAIALRLVAAAGDSIAPFEQVRDLALVRWRQERDSKALRSFIDELRAQADMVTPK